MTATFLFVDPINLVADRPAVRPVPVHLPDADLCLQASYAAPLILLAQNRQEARDRVQYDADRDVDARTRADMEFLAREVAVAAAGDGRGRHPGLPPLGAAGRSLAELDERPVDALTDGRPDETEHSHGTVGPDD